MVIGPDKKVLVVSQNGNSWSLPKGHVDPGENELAAAIRETQEESGINQLELIQKLGSYQRHQIALDGSENKEELKTIHIFLFKTHQSKLQPEDPHNPEARWVDPDRVAELLTHPKDKEFYLSILPIIRELVV